MQFCSVLDILVQITHFNVCFAFEWRKIPEFAGRLVKVVIWKIFRTIMELEYRNDNQKPSILTAFQDMEQLT